MRTPRKTTALAVLAVSALMAATGCSQKGSGGSGSGSGSDSGSGSESATVAFVPKLQGIPTSRR